MSDLTQLPLFDIFDDSSFPRPGNLVEAVEVLASNNDIGTRGAIFTRIEVVNFILDLAGYVVTDPLHLRRTLEPSFGNGAFLLPIIDRLLLSWRNYGGSPSAASTELGESLRGVELHRATFASTREAVINRLEQEGFLLPIALELVDRWLIQGDFLLEPLENCFDFVLGNPPYVRQELIPAPLLTEYRRRYQTMYDRADLYIPFIERSLALLGENGTLGFICADRWMKNRYGGPLRNYVDKGFHLKVYVDMMDTDAFHSEVSAYPAIIVINKSGTASTRIAYRPKIDKKELAEVATEINLDVLPQGSAVREIVGVTSGAEPWLLESSDQMALIRKIESVYPLIEQVGCKIGIGVATGADKAFIGNFEALDVEPGRKLPLVSTRDIQSGEVVWQGCGVINPFSDEGSLVDLHDYPRLARYFEERKTVIANRHCAQKAPLNWYRTIDRIWPELTRKPKLLIPDIKGEAHVVFEQGKLYPHHNLYYVTSETWDIIALQAVLLSSVAKFFVSTYSTKMRGGYLRFQAQYLRRICIPYWTDVSPSLRQELIHAAIARDLNACNKAVFQLYNLSQKECSILNCKGE